MKRHTILLDTNILSIFAELNELNLLLTALDRHSLHISPAIHRELTVGLFRGHLFLQNALTVIGENQPITIVPLTSSEAKSLKKLPTWLAVGEAEGVVICQRRGWMFASYDRKAVDYCRRNAILILTLNDILAALWQGKFVSKDEVSRIIAQLEAGGRLIKAKAEILKD